jgi:hypothetical protein
LAICAIQPKFKSLFRTLFVRYGFPTKKAWKGALRPSTGLILCRSPISTREKEKKRKREKEKKRKREKEKMRKREKEKKRKREKEKKRKREKEKKRTREKEKRNRNRKKK